MSFQIIGTGRATPELILTNDMISEMVDTNDDWIISRTGIKTRFVSTKETLLDLSSEAAGRAFQKAEIEAKEIDLIICSTMKGDYVSPALSCLIQQELGAVCPAFDLNAACSGFVYALDAADSYIRAGKAETVLVVAVEAMTRHIDWSDRATCVLFGDGAGAVVLRKGEGLQSIKISAKGDKKLITIGSVFSSSPFSTHEQVNPNFWMNGGEVFKFAVTSIMRDVKHVMKEAGVTPEDIKMMVPHQANERVFAFAREKLGFREEQIASGIDHYGNTSSASIPLLLDELIETGKLIKGDRIVLTAFGGGLTTGACVIKL